MFKFLVKHVALPIIESLVTGAIVETGSEAVKYILLQQKCKKLGMKGVIVPQDEYQDLQEFQIQSKND